MEKWTTFLGRSETGVFAQGLFAGAMEKTAGVPGATWDTADEIRSYIRTLTPEDRKRYCYVLVNALGAGEYFGSNVNADFFPWDALRHEGQDYGYLTFLNAHAFAHHVNKDPAKAFGIPVISVLNHRMKRVELIIKLDREKARIEGAEAIIARIDDGGFPDVSMGCKVPYDVCSICGNHSKTRDDYCEHMRPPPELRGIYGPNKILPDGRKIYVVNTLPRFFDISFVFIGADKTAKVMAKLASKGRELCLGEVCAVPSTSQTAAPQSSAPLYDSLGRQVEFRKVASAGERTGPCGKCCASCERQEPCESDKLAAAFGVKQAETKTSELVKRIPGNAFSTTHLPNIERREPDLPREVLDQLAEHPLPDSTGALTAAGIVLKPREFQRIVIIRLGDRDWADDLDRRRLTFRPVHRFDDSVDPELPPNAELLRTLLPLIGSRSGYSPALRLRMAKLAMKKNLPTGGSIEHPVLDKISAAYNGYRRNVLMKMSQAREEVLGDPTLREAVLGSDLVTMFSKSASADEIISHDTVAYMMGAHLSDRSLLSTTAGVVIPKSLLEEHLA